MKSLCLGIAAFLLSTRLVSAVGAESRPALATEPTSRPARLSIFSRLSKAQLERFDRDREALAKKVQRVDVPYPFVRGTFHMHSRLSHDSRGTVTEIVAAAKATGTRVVGMTAHPSDKVDVIREGLKGWIDGVYFLAGVEKGGAIFWPGTQGEEDLRFVSHPEERLGFDRAGFAGMEIYNTHSDVLDEPAKKLLMAMMVNLASVKDHLDAAFEAYVDYPAAFMARYDALTLEAPFAGLAANDSHQNVAFKLVAMPDGTVEVFDFDSKRVYKAEGIAAKILRNVFGRQTDVSEPTVIADMKLDPYERSMRHVGTFMQIDGVSEKTVRHALRTGRMVLGFEIIAPLPSMGFWVERDGRPLGTVGDQVAWQSGLTLRAVLPAEAGIRIIRNGKVIHEASADRCTYSLAESGVYRCEAFVTLAGEQWPWVIGNPIYVK